jgi:preprotein translocase subunit SecG
MLFGLILGIHVLVCVILVLIVLLQSSKGSGLAGGGAFGGGADSTVFGGRGAATFLSKATTVFGVAFMLTSMTLTLMSKSGGERPRSAVAEEARSQAATPVQTAPPTMPGMPAQDGALPPADGALPPGGAPPPPAGTTPTPTPAPQGTDPSAPPVTPNGG